MGAKRRIMSACVRLFLEKGYTRTTVAEIIGAADVSISTFQNIFRTKDGVLRELAGAVFSRQFEAAGRLAGKEAGPVSVYALETALQLMIAERNENLRDIYLEAYTQAGTAEYIHRKAAAELCRIFGSYMPECAESDFYEMDIGTAGLMRGYMARSCDMYFPLEKKLARFLGMSMKIYSVPREERERVLAWIGGLDLDHMAKQAAQELFQALAEQFDFSLAPSCAAAGKTPLLSGSAGES